MEREFESRPFTALVTHLGPLSACFRVTVDAKNLEDAKQRLEAEYGLGRVFSLWNEEDANAPGSSRDGRLCSLGLATRRGDV
jgi:hypothetical protein